MNYLGNNFIIFFVLHLMWIDSKAYSNSISIITKTTKKELIIRVIRLWNPSVVLASFLTLLLFHGIFFFIDMWAFICEQFSFSSVPQLSISVFKIIHTYGIYWCKRVRWTNECERNNEMIVIAKMSRVKQKHRHRYYTGRGAQL